MGQVLLSSVLHCRLIKLMDDKMIHFGEICFGLLIKTAWMSNRCSVNKTCIQLVAT